MRRSPVLIAGRSLKAIEYIQWLLMSGATAELSAVTESEVFKPLREREFYAVIVHLDERLMGARDALHRTCDSEMAASALLGISLQNLHHKLRRLKFDTTESETDEQRKDRAAATRQSREGRGVVL